MAKTAASIDDYISGCSAEVQFIMEGIRTAMHEAVPGAGETISYQMPTLTLAGHSVVHFAAWKHHIGLYPVPVTDDGLAERLAPYTTGQGTARFPLDQPIPYDLIGELTAVLAERLQSSRSPQAHPHTS